MLHLNVLQVATHVLHQLSILVLYCYFFTILTLIISPDAARDILVLALSRRICRPLVKTPKLMRRIS